MCIELVTERLLLRPLNVSDLQTVHKYASDAETMKYMFHLPKKSLEETRSFISRVSAEWQISAGILKPQGLLWKNSLKQSLL